MDEGAQTLIISLREEQCDFEEVILIAEKGDWEMTKRR